MKRNHEQAAKYILAAIRELGQDFSLSEARQYLRLAAESIARVGARRTSRENQRIVGEKADKLRKEALERQVRKNWLESGGGGA